MIGRLVTSKWTITHVGGVQVTHKRDQRNSITSALGLTWYGDRLAGVVESPKAKDQISALLDLVDLQQCGAVASPAGVALLLVSPAPEAVGALKTLCQAVSGHVHVSVLRLDGDDSWTPTGPADFNLAHEEPHYRGWPKLLEARFNAPSLVEQLLDAAQTPKLRAYPQLSATGECSIRLEGLQIGRVRGTSGFLDVGKMGKTSTPGKPGKLSAERTAWLEVHPDGRLEFDASKLAHAAAKLQAFARAWNEKAGGRPNEHALESRILRGDVPVIVGGRPLELIEPDPRVSWGSQFPTKWGPCGRARYLDALLRDPVERDVPWAVEMKVGLGGEGQYYRHAVAQAVLYRHFIRSASSLWFWFDHYDLDATKCRAAVVVPEFRNPSWESRLARLCELFDVRLVTVPDAATLP